jgi:hypothetical protein
MRSKRLNIFRSQNGVGGGTASVAGNALRNLKLQQSKRNREADNAPFGMDSMTNMPYLGYIDQDAQFRVR